MNITNFFGEYLSKLIKKRPMACKGLIRLAVKDEFPGKSPEQLDYTKLKYIFNKTLKNRLQRIEAPNTKNIIQRMVSYLVINQSLLTMA